MGMSGEESFWLVTYDDEDVKIVDRNMERLRGNRWLTDDIIEGYSLLLKKKFCWKSFEILGSIEFAGFLRTLQFGPGNSRRRRSQTHDYANYAKIYQPVHTNGDHWILLVADTEEKEIIVYDSFGKGNEEYVSSFKKLLRKCTLLDLDWRINNLGSSTPQQQDDIQCGAFVCMAMLWLLNDREPNYSHDFVKNDGREHIRSSIKKNRIVSIRM